MYLIFFPLISFITPDKQKQIVILYICLYMYMHDIHMHACARARAHKQRYCTNKLYRCMMPLPPIKPPNKIRTWPFWTLVVATETKETGEDAIIILKARKLIWKLWQKIYYLKGCHWLLLSVIRKHYFNPSNKRLCPKPLQLLIVCADSSESMTNCPLHNIQRSSFNIETIQQIQKLNKKPSIIKI